MKRYTYRIPKRGVLSFYLVNPTGCTFLHPNTPSNMPNGLKRFKTSRAIKNPQPGGLGAALCEISFRLESIEKKPLKSKHKHDPVQSINLKK